MSRRSFAIVWLAVSALLSCTSRNEKRDPVQEFLQESFKGKFGYIDDQGNVAIQPRFESAAEFSDGLARVGVQNRFGFLDKLGRMAIAPQYADAGNFSEGLAPVEIAGNWGYIDKLGKIA